MGPRPDLTDWKGVVETTFLSLEIHNEVGIGQKHNGEGIMEQCVLFRRMTTRVNTEKGHM